MVSVKLPDKHPLIAESRFQDDYRVVQRIGDGGYATVFLAETKQEPHTRVAVKKMAKQRPGHTADTLTTRYLNEARYLKENQHKHIVNFITCYNEEDFFYLVTEYLSGDDLFSQINTLERRFREHECRKIITGILLAIKHLHDHNIIHRDIKLENIMLMSPNSEKDTSSVPNSSHSKSEMVKVIDFGFATEVNGMNASGGMGTIYYAAPEIFKREIYGKPIDLWSLGVLTYCLIYGRYPFYSENKTELAQQILSTQYKFHYYNRARELVSEEMKSFLMGLLVVDPLKRMTVEQALKHPWIRPSISIVTATFVIRACKKWKKFYQQKQQLKRLLLLESSLQKSSLTVEETVQSFSGNSTSSVQTMSVDFSEIMEEASISHGSKKVATSVLFPSDTLLEAPIISTESSVRMDVSPELEIEKRYSRRLWYHMKQVFSTFSTFIPISNE